MLEHALCCTREKNRKLCLHWMVSLFRSQHATSCSLLVPWSTLVVKSSLLKWNGHALIANSLNREKFTRVWGEALRALRTFYPSQNIMKLKKIRFVLMKTTTHYTVLYFAKFLPLLLTAHEKCWNRDCTNKGQHRCTNNLRNLKNWGQGKKWKILMTCKRPYTVSSHVESTASRFSMAVIRKNTALFSTAVRQMLKKCHSIREAAKLIKANGNTALQQRGAILQQHSSLWAKLNHLQL